MQNSITWKIGGEAGFGIMSSGIMLSKIYSRSGYRILCTNEYPSLIRGGLNLVSVRISTQKVEAMNRDLNILVALSKLCVETCKNDLSENAIVVYDPKDGEWKESDFPKPVKLLPLPLGEILNKLGAKPIMKNTITIGATLALLGGDIELLNQMLKEQFGKKGDEVVNSNIEVAKAGYDYVKENFPNEDSVNLPSGGEPEKLLVINGSEAVGVAAVRAGLNFAAIYPMTPINALITFLADHEKQLDIVYTQPEDEIAGINMAIGASVAGARAMVATSGGGFALMTEALSLAGMAEVPLVIDMGMRVGPASGMPTWTEQGELDFVIHAGHGEFQRIVLAPGDAEEVFTLTVDAFNLASVYQVPVFILTDKYLNESQWCVPYETYAAEVEIKTGKVVKPEELKEDESFKRYSLDTEDGVSSRSLPGMKYGNYISHSYEHDEIGLVTEDAEMRVKMSDKRLKKAEAIKNLAYPPTVYGEEDAEITFVNWGTTKGPVLEAIELLNKKKVKANLIHFTWLFPFPQKVEELLKKAKRLVLVEQNSTAQLGGQIRRNTGIDIEEKLLKYDGRPFFPEEIVERINL
ncbi:2-oxoacid:acceptor oxidoreductase subunit alpha [Patescibacteria group bacterium]